MDVADQFTSGKVWLLTNIMLKMICNSGISQLILTIHHTLGPFFIAFSQLCPEQTSFNLVNVVKTGDWRQNLLNCKIQESFCVAEPVNYLKMELSWKVQKEDCVTVTQLGYNRFWLFAILQDCQPLICLCTQILCQYQNNWKKRWEAIFRYRLI